MATERETRKITLHLYDTEMTVNVPIQEEEYYRNAAKRITDTVNAYASHFKGQKSDKDIQYMAMVEIALRLEKELLRSDPTPMFDVLSKLSSEIDNLLDAKA